MRGASRFLNVRRSLKGRVVVLSSNLGISGRCHCEKSIAVLIEGFQCKM